MSVLDELVAMNPTRRVEVRKNCYFFLNNQGKSIWDTNSTYGIGYDLEIVERVLMILCEVKLNEY